MEKKKVSVAYVLLKTVMIVLIIFFASDGLMQFISYSFYKGDRKFKEVRYEPIELEIKTSGKESLYGYGYNLDSKSSSVILFFGGSMYIAYNSVGMYGGLFGCPFLSVDYYGSQKSSGKMNLQTMQKSATDLYDYAKSRY
ncbi:MAG: hypothetical protein IIU30_11970, partial [Treponema sp.]|nr:hypothetical protein [Treponema sp.]